MNPIAAPTAESIKTLYVSPGEDAVAQALVSKLELEPRSSHLVAGGIGTGKTSELLLARLRLNASFPEVGDHVEYIDISAHHDLQAGNLEGVLIAAAGVVLAQHFHRQKKPADAVTKAAIEAVNKHARGYQILIDPSDFDDDPGPPPDDDDGSYYHTVAGRLQSPDRPIPWNLQNLVPHLKNLRRACFGGDGNCVLMFDSLDRLPDPEHFRQAVEYDLRILKSAGFGVVVVGPIRLVVGSNRIIGDLFDFRHYQLAADPEIRRDCSFLKAVLRKRAPEEILPDKLLRPLAIASGGVMRDLLSLAKAAGESAYTAGRPAISARDTDLAINKFARSLAIGLDSAQIELLKKSLELKDFVLTDERDITLLETRRVLLFRSNRWGVQPALAELLQSVAVRSRKAS